MSMTNGRKQNSIKNSMIGMLTQFLLLLLSFVGRYFFVVTLGKEFLGLNGLYSNILSILSLADLGCNSVFLYRLYKPISNNDDSYVANLLNLYKKIYRIVAFVILILGLLLLPFLPLIVNTSIEFHIVIISYLLTLLNSIVSYIVAYKSVLIIAYQKNYIINIFQLITNFIKNVFQIMALLIYKDYFLYLIILIFSTMINCFLINYYFNHKYDQIWKKIKDKNRIKIKDNTSSLLFKDIKSMMGYKLANVAINNTDNILISIIVGTSMVGLYSNYIMIINAVTTFIGVIYNGIQASIGNLNANQDNNKKYKIFNVVLFFYNYIGTLGLIGFSLVSNDFISLWIGKEYTLRLSIILVISFNFYISTFTNPILLYRETFGLFKNVTKIIIITAILNLLFSVIFGIYFGLFGILASTFLSKCITIVWYEPKILFKNGFSLNQKDYWMKQMKFFALTLIVFAICLIFHINSRSLLFNVIINGTIIFSATSLSYFIVYHNSTELNYLLNIFRRKNNGIG